MPNRRFSTFRRLLLAESQAFCEAAASAALLIFQGHQLVLGEGFVPFELDVSRSFGVGAEGLFYIVFWARPTRIHMMNRIQDISPHGRKSLSGTESPRSSQHELSVQFGVREKVISELQPTSLNLSHGSIQGLKWMNTIKDLTRALGLSRSSLYSKIRQGLFPSGIKFGASRRWLASDIIAWLEQQRSRGEQA